MLILNAVPPIRHDTRYEKMRDLQKLFNAHLGLNRGWRPLGFAQAECFGHAGVMQ